MSIIQYCKQKIWKRGGDSIKVVANRQYTETAGDFQKMSGFGHSYANLTVIIIKLISNKVVASD